MNSHILRPFWVTLPFYVFYSNYKLLIPFMNKYFIVSSTSVVVEVCFVVVVCEAHKQTHSKS